MKACNAVGVEPITLHEARHCAVSFFIASGLDLKHVSTWAGHSDIRTTLNRYGHVIPGSERDAADRPDRISRRPDCGALWRTTASRGQNARRYWADQVPLPGFEPARGPVTVARFADFPAIRPLGYRSGPLGRRSRLWHNCGAPSRARGAAVARVRRCEWWWAKAAVRLSAQRRSEHPVRKTRVAHRKQVLGPAILSGKPLAGRGVKPRSHTLRGQRSWLLRGRIGRCRMLGRLVGRALRR